MKQEPKWKERLSSGFEDADDLADFISTEIIAKLIKEIPDYGLSNVSIMDLKQELRDKWLNN